ncbi:FAD-linked oxidoreductase apf9 [Cladobotryum mycophilum]|uniref:FAD-linked oxidoreductase apf9 n=1 Tax=Cladobotryum mycophilum TaxID=491253 RepID=A0ABR0SUB4_9HYPO
MGEVLTINGCQHSDLFWAMRGGGGSTFGVITSITLKIFPSPKILAMDFMMLVDARESFIYDMAAFIFGQLPTLGGKGMTGYTSVLARMPNPIPLPGAPEEVGGVIGVAVLQDTSEENDMLKLWKPINDTVNTKWPGKVQFLPRIVAYKSYLDYINVHYDNMTTGGDFYMASRLLDKTALTGNSKALSRAIEGVVDATDGLTAFLVAGEGIHNVVASKAFPPLNATAKAGAIKQLNTAMEPFRQLSPSTGAYINEGFPFEKDWQKTFWGENYPRLLAIKKKIDPENVLWCHNCVGSEGWTDDKGQLCKRRN